MVVTNKNDLWFLVDTTSSKFTDVRTEAVTRHKTAWSHAKLSVLMNLAGTKALIKVRGAKSWNPDWKLEPLILRIFTPQDHADAIVMIHTLEWEIPDVS